MGNEKNRKKIFELLDHISEVQDDIGTKFRGMSYEDGLRAMWDFLNGDSEDPMGD